MSRVYLKSILALAVIASAFSNVVAQDHFIGEGKTVNRVIRLESNADKPVERVAKKVTSRAVQQQRATSSTMNPSLVKFDEIGVPRTLQQPMKPVVQQQAPRVQQFQTRQPVPPTTSNTFAKPVSFATKKKPTTTPTKTTKVTPLVTRSGNSVTTEISSPRFINVNQPAQLSIAVRNEGKDSIENVKLITRLPQHAKFLSSSPQPVKIDENTYEFTIARLAGSDTRNISLRVVPTQKQTMEVSTQVRVENSQRTLVAVRQPALALSLNGPQQTNIGQTVTHELIVTNVGDGVATDINLDTVFPESLRRIKQSGGPVISRIEPGKSAKITYESMAHAPGKVELKVAANGEGVEPQKTSLDVNVYQPELRISAVGPKLNFVQRDGIYTIGIENTGEVDITDVRVSLAVPQGMKVTTINRQANVDAQRGILTWSFAKIGAASSEQIQLKTTATEEGQQVCNILVSSHQTRDKEIQLTTMVTTRADISVRIKNQTGPVQVGGKAEFVVEVENHGSRSATDVAVRVNLPETLNAVQSEGSFGEKEGNGLVFTEPQVAPGQKMSFKFSAVGVAAGDHVVRSVLQTEGSERRVIAEDTVYVYEVDQARVSESVSPALPRR